MRPGGALGTAVMPSPGASPGTLSKDSGQGTGHKLVLETVPHFLGVGGDVYHKGRVYPNKLCEATTLNGFVQQVADSWVKHGYWCYVTGEIPAGKNPARTDARIIAKYETDISSAERSRRRQSGRPLVRYIRHENFFGIFATEGHGPNRRKHPFFLPVGEGGESERNKRGDEVRIQHVQRDAFRFGGYSISHRNGRLSVRIEKREYLALKAHFLERARWGESRLVDEFHAIPFEFWAPVKLQVHTILRAVNRARKRSSYDQIPWERIRRGRRIYRPFEHESHVRHAA